jgi:hypothetical protein
MRMTVFWDVGPCCLTFYVTTRHDSSGQQHLQYLYSSHSVLKWSGFILDPAACATAYYLLQFTWRQHSIVVTSVRLVKSRFIQRDGTAVVAKQIVLFLAVFSCQQLIICIQRRDVIWTSVLSTVWSERAVLISHSGPCLVRSQVTRQW